jgi:hypothetical protein
VRIAPINSLLFISDIEGGMVPDFLRGSRILSTDSCISVGCLMWQDGETEVTLGDAAAVGPKRNAAFDGMLDTPNLAVLVSTVDLQPILRGSVPSAKTRVQIWVNRDNEPDKIIIGLQ